MDIHAAPFQYSQSKCQTRNDVVLSRNNWGTRTASFLAKGSPLCSRVPAKTCYPRIHLDFSCCSSTCHMPQQLFLATCLFLPTGRFGEGVNSPAPIILPSSHLDFLSCTHLTLRYTTPPLITLFLFWPFSASNSLYCYVSRETLVSEKVLWEKRMNSAPFLSPVSSYQLALGTSVIWENVPLTEIRKVSVFLFTVEHNCWHFSTFPFSTFLGNWKIITIFSSEGRDLQEHIALEVLWFSNGKAEHHAAFGKPEQRWIKLSRSLKWHLNASHCFCCISLIPGLFQNTFPAVPMPLIITNSSIK